MHKGTLYNYGHNADTCVGSINFVTADGVKFAHPLSHLGKSKKVFDIT